jgi:hypothetical protein
LFASIELKTMLRFGTMVGWPTSGWPSDFGHGASLKPLMRQGDLVVFDAQLGASRLGKA